jgi:hypothetical protein
LYSILGSSSLEELYERLRGVNTIGDFLAMQYAIDLNYSILFDFREEEFIMEGPGARKGIDRTFTIEGKPNYPEIIKWVHDNLDTCMETYGFKPLYLPNRKPSLIDIQNCFCETDKLLRDKGVETEGKDIEGKRMKSIFSHASSSSKKSVDYFLPPKWNVDSKEIVLKAFNL